MNKKLLAIFVLVSFVFGFVLVNGLTYDDSDSEDQMLVKVNVLQSTVSISVPDNLIIGEIAAGYLTEEQGFDIKNTGTVDIQVVPELVAESTNDEMFNNFVFKRIQADELTKIGLFSVDIEKPNVVGGERAQNVYLQLDLTNYKGDLTTGLNNATIVFTAVPL